MDDGVFEKIFNTNYTIKDTERDCMHDFNSPSII